MARTLAAIDAAANDLNKNKELVEQFAADIKTTFAPEDPKSQEAQTLYAAAKGVTDEYLGRLSLAALTGDTSASLGSVAADAHSATTAFAEGATRSLSPETADKGLVVGLAIKALPTVLKVLGAMPSHQRAATVQSFCNKVRWRSWDEIPSSLPQKPSHTKGGL